MKLTHMRAKETISGGLELVLLFDTQHGEAVSLRPGASAQDVAATLRRLAARVESLAAPRRSPGWTLG